MSPSLHWSVEVPALRRPVLIVALDGFIDAGDAAETAARFLRHRWLAAEVAIFDPDTFIDYRARRPTVVIDSGVLRRVEMPQTKVYAASIEGSAHDAVFLLGPEPDMAWEHFFDTVVGLCRSLGVEQALGLGAYPTATPHTRPTPVTSARNLVSGDVLPTAVEVSGYTGPVGAQVVLQHRLGEAGIPMVSAYAEVPHYIAANAHPRSALALVSMIAAAFGVTIDTTELEAAANAHDSQVDEAVADHPEAAAMIQRLEAHVDGGGTSLQVPSGDDLAAEIERFLSDRGESGQT